MLIFLMVAPTETSTGDIAVGDSEQLE